MAHFNKEEECTIAQVYRYLTCYFKIDCEIPKKLPMSNGYLKFRNVQFNLARFGRF